MNQLTVLYDPDCPLCVRAWRWFDAQPKYLPVEFLPQGTDAAKARFPDLPVGAGDPVEDLIAVGDDGAVYRNARAWVMCLYALRDYRPLALRLGHPALLPLAKRAYQTVSGNRHWLSRYFGAKDHQTLTHDALADRIKTHSAPVADDCHDPQAPAACKTDPAP